MFTSVVTNMFATLVFQRHLEAHAGVFFITSMPKHWGIKGWKQRIGMLTTVFPYSQRSSMSRY